MQEFCSSCRAQTLEAYWVISHHCRALLCSYPFLTTHKSCSQSNQTESLVSLAASVQAASLPSTFVPIHWGVDHLLYRHIHRTKGWVKASLGLGYRTLCLWNHCGVPWAGRGQQPSPAGGLCAVVWRSWLCWGQPGVRATGISWRDAWKMLYCCWPCIRAAWSLGNNRAGSLSCALPAAPLPAEQCRQTFAVAS